MKNNLVKLWSVTVNSWGWDSARTYYARSKEAAANIANNFPASDPVRYAGMFSEEKARELLGERTSLFD